MNTVVSLRRICFVIWAALFSLGTILFLGGVLPPLAANPQRKVRSATSPAPSAGAVPPAIVVGFVGGFIRHDDPVHSEVQLAARLRKKYPSGVHVETFESYRGENARKQIHRLLDVNQDGFLTPAEKMNARIVLYGHSWGASEAIMVARELGSDGIPVLLTVQVDSIAKFYQNDKLIPPNVAKAANFYQPGGFVHGQAAIRAADPARTKIVGNFRFDYRAAPYTCNEYPWYDRIFVKSHTQIECDPNVWNQAEDLIRTVLSPASRENTP